MSSVRLMITGKMGAGKSSAAAYLERAHGATRWTRSESMKRLAHALADQVGDLEGLLSAVLPDPVERDVVRDELMRFIAGYTPELGKPRQLYQDVAQIVMEQDPLAFERELMERMRLAEREGAPFSLVDDVRSPAAFAFFADHGYASLRIHASEEVRRRRMLSRDGYLPAEASFSHPSETDLDAVEHDFSILNDSDDPTELWSSIDQIVALLSARALTP